MKIKSSPNSLKHYFDAYGFSNISKEEFNSEIERYKSLGKDQKTVDFISKFLLKYGLNNQSKQWTFENTEYTNSYTKINFICKKHGIKSHLPYKMLNDKVSQGCKECGNTKSHINISKEEYRMKLMRHFSFDLVEKMYNKVEKKISLEELRNQLSYYESLGKDDKTLRFIAISLIKNGKMENISYNKSKYFGRNDKLMISCLHHGDFYISPSKHYGGSGCPKCSMLSLRSNYDDIKKDPRYTYDDEWNREHWSGMATSNIKYTCKIHGEIEQRALKHFLSNHGCPLCSESHMENRLHQRLTSFGMKYGIDFVREKEFPDLIGDFDIPLRFDFFFPLKNVLIELDGLLHFDLRYQSDEDFKRRKRYDELKTKYASDHGFKLIRIKYDQFDEWLSHITSINSFNLAVSKYQK